MQLLPVWSICYAAAGSMPSSPRHALKHALPSMCIHPSRDVLVVAVALAGLDMTGYLLLQALLDWLAEHGSGEHLGALLTRAAASTLSLQPAVDLAVRAGPTKGWWAELQPGLLAAFGRAHSEADMPAVLGQLRRVQQASGVCGRAEAGGAAVSAASVQRYMQLAAAVMGVLEREPDKDMTPRPPPVGHYRGRYHSTAYSAPPSTPPRTADFVQDLLLAIYVPDCPGELRMLAAAAPAWLGTSSCMFMGHNLF